MGLAGDLIAFEQLWHLAASQAACRQHLLAPVAPRHVQPAGSCGVRHVAGEFAGEAPAQVILGQQDFIYTFEQLGLMLPYPQQFGGGKARHHQVASDLPRLRHRLFQRQTLCGASAVVP
ncbi:hypothetical protein D3C72_914990 [compost metagenome]